MNDLLERHRVPRRTGVVFLGGGRSEQRGNQKHGMCPAHGAPYECEGSIPETKAEHNRAAVDDALTLCGVTANQTVLIFGATGTAGSGAVQACLEDADVGEIRAVARRALGREHPKLTTVRCDDFEDLSAITPALKDVDICLFCLGVSARVVSEEAAYRRIHEGYALAAANALAEHSPEARFVYLSGQGAKRTSSMMWARVKAEAEDALKQAFPASASVRPGYIHPMKPRGWKRWLLGPLLRVFPFLGIRAKQLGRAMLAAGRATPPAQIPVRNRVLRRSGESGLRRGVRRGLKLLGVFLLLFACFVAVQIWEPIGKAPGGARLARMEASSNWTGEGFRNPIDVRMNTWGAMKEAMFGDAGKTVPTVKIPAQPVDPSLFKTPPASGVRVTWFGHSTMLIEIDGRRFLTDPVWGDRASPLSWVGPQRWYPPVLALEDLPALDAVLISHDHYDHLDHETIVAMRDWDTVFIVPLGVGAHLEYWGVPAKKIIALDWWEQHAFGDVDVVCTPARHFSGRFIGNRFRSLWCGYALTGPTRRAFFSGDSSLFPGLEEIGKRLGPFDITMLDMGAYAQSWADVHMGPEEGVLAHRMLRGNVLLPVHWGLFNLAPHGWTEPIERGLVAAQRAGVTIVAPRPGDSIDPTAPTPVKRWWPQIRWRTAEEYPVRASR